MPTSPFVAAGDLSGAFYREVVRPLLAGTAHEAALLGWGSDVLGYDTPRSTDHGWGPRLLVFVENDDVAKRVRQRLELTLPQQFRGWPVRYGWDAVPAAHRVTVTTLSAWLVEFLGVDATAGMSTLDWMLTPQQRLLGVVAGPVYADQGGALARIRDELAWYPDQIWRWLLACQWHRLSQEEAFVARTAEVGDLIGSAVTASRMVRVVMRLVLLLDRRYAPYQKWLGPRSLRAATKTVCPGIFALRCTLLSSKLARPRSSAPMKRWPTVTTTQHSHRGSTRSPATITTGRPGC